MYESQHSLGKIPEEDLRRIVRKYGLEGKIRIRFSDPTTKESDSCLYYYHDGLEVPLELKKASTSCSQVRAYEYFVLYVVHTRSLKNMKKAQLVELANKKGVDSSGTKADIADRLENVLEPGEEEELERYVIPPDAVFEQATCATPMHTPHRLLNCNLGVPGSRPRTGDPEFWTKHRVDDEADVPDAIHAAQLQGERRPDLKKYCEDYLQFHQSLAEIETKPTGEAVWNWEEKLPEIGQLVHQSLNQ